MIYDYYNNEDYAVYFKKFFYEVSGLCDNNDFNDIYLSYLENREKFSNWYDIDSEAYLFHLIRRYALRGKKERKKFLKHPYIKSYKIDKDKTHISTIFGDLDFKFWIKGFADVVLFTYKNKGNGFIKETAKIYLDELSGKYNGRCHEGSIQFGYGRNIVTAFMHEPLSNLRFLHSFVDNDETVLEATANIVISKNDYYRLLKPEIVSVIPGEELYDFYNEYMNKYPRLRGLSTKQLLVDYDEIRKNPETIKLKKCNRKR